MTERSLADDFRCAIGWAVRAPSSHNSQPWRFRTLPTGIELRADSSRLLRVVDPQGRELLISCGAALFHLRRALQHLGHAVAIDVLPDAKEPSLLARVECALKPGTSASPSLFRAICQRQTHRGAFLKRELPQGLLPSLQAAADAEGAWLARIDGVTRASLAELVAQGDKLQYGDPLFRKELASWLRPNASLLGDGLAGYTIGFGNSVSRVAPLLVRAVNVGSLQARVDRKLTLDAPAVVVLATDRDDPGHWLAAGQALGHMLLLAAVDGVSAGFMNQPVQCPTLRRQLNAMLDSRGFAQVVIRLGHAELGRPSWRRPLEAVID